MSYIVFYPETHFVHINTCQAIAESLQVMTIPIEQKNVDRSNAQMTTG